MRVGINLLWVVPGDVGGSESWVRGLLEAVVADPPTGVEPVVFATPALLDAHPYLRTFEVVAAPAAIGASRPRRVLAESTWLAAAARRRRLDVLHHPGGTVPPLTKKPALLTIHDLQPLALPEHFSPTKLRYLRARLGPSVRAARVTSAVSRFAADDVVARLGADPTRVLVTPPAVDPDPPDLGGVAGVDGPWFLYPAVTWPHKDHATLLAAFDLVRRSHPEARLVLTGGAGPAEDAVANSVRRTGSSVRRTGRVDDVTLDALVRGAVAVAFPSRYEAVGIPLLEAMARGTAVLASDVPGPAATVGAAGRLVPAGDVEAWAAAMVELLDRGPDPALVAAGRERVKAWAPAASRAKLVEAWAAAAG